MVAAIVRAPCPGCGEPFEARSPSRVYCSDACRCRASARRTVSGQVPAYERTCIECQHGFSTPIPGILTCSEECRSVRERRRESLRMRGPSQNLCARQRNRAWAEQRRNVVRVNPWLAGAPPYGSHLPGVTTPITIDPVPRWPVELRNTRGLHGAMTAILGVGHDAHVPYWALRPWQSGWAVHWLHDAGASRFVCTRVAAAVYDRPSTVAFGAAIRWRAPAVPKRGHQRVRVTTLTPVVIRTDGGAVAAERASGASLVGCLSTEFARRISPSPSWHQWVRDRVRVDVLENETHPAHVPLGDKYGVVHGWEGSVTLDVNAVARWLLEAASRIGMGSRVAFGFGSVRTEAA